MNTIQKLANDSAQYILDEIASKYPNHPVIVMAAGQSIEEVDWMSVGYLKWACEQVITHAHAGDWSNDKLHRWVGWCQCLAAVLDVQTPENIRIHTRNLINS